MSVAGVRVVEFGRNSTKIATTRRVRQINRPMYTAELSASAGGCEHVITMTLRRWRLRVAAARQQDYEKDGGYQSEQCTDYLEHGTIDVSVTWSAMYSDARNQQQTCRNTSAKHNWTLFRNILPRQRHVTLTVNVTCLWRGKMIDLCPFDTKHTAWCINGVQLSARRRTRLPVDHAPTSLRESRLSLFTFGCTWRSGCFSQCVTVPAALLWLTVYMELLANVTARPVINTDILLSPTEDLFCRAYASSARSWLLFYCQSGRT